MGKFECIQCGECCKKMLICISYSDIVRWSEQERSDILREVSYAEGCPTGDGFYFAETVTKPKKTCPFLVDDLCSIHATKPMSCKDAPAGFSKFKVCPVWSYEKHFNRKRYKKVVRRQTKDFKKAMTNFQSLFAIIVRARNNG